MVCSCWQVFPYQVSVWRLCIVVLALCGFIVAGCWCSFKGAAFPLLCICIIKLIPHLDYLWTYTARFLLDADLMRHAYTRYSAHQLEASNRYSQPSTCTGTEGNIMRENNVILKGKEIFQVADQ